MPTRKQEASLPSDVALAVSLVEQLSMSSCRQAFEWASQHERPAFEVHPRYGIKSRRNFATFVTEVPTFANLVRSNTVVQRISAPFEFTLLGTKSLRSTYDKSSGEHVLDEGLLVCLCPYSEVAVSPVCQDKNQSLCQDKDQSLWKLRVVYECLPRDQVDAIVDSKKEVWQVTSRGTVINFKCGEVWMAYLERASFPYVQHNLPEFLPSLWSHDQQELFKAYAQFLAMPDTIKTTSSQSVGCLLVEAWTNSFKNKRFGELAPFLVDKTTQSVVPLGMHAKLWFELQVDSRGTSLAQTKCDTCLAFYSTSEFCVRTKLATFRASRVGKHFKVDKSFWEVRNFRVELVSAKPCKVSVLCEFLTHRAKTLLDKINVVGVLEESTHSIDFKATNLTSSTRQALSNLLCDATQVTKGMTWN
jgi:tRNA isopentenyl-2-thiomethyl-A-37 hydroxylase MiaE